MEEISKFKKNLETILKETPNTKIELPSRGVIYDEDDVLSKGHVHIRYMRGEDEEVLLSPKHIKEDTFLEALLEKVVLEPDFNVYDLSAGDRLYLVLSTRVMSLGSKFHIPKVVCPRCEHVHENVEFDVEQIQEKDIKHEPTEPHKNEFKFTLPQTEDLITIRVTTGNLEQEISKNMKKMKQMGQEYTINHDVSEILINSTGIDSQGDTPSYGEKLKYVRSLPIKDSQMLRKFSSEINGLPDNTVPFECEDVDCGHSFKVPVQFGISFFFPNI